MADFDKKPAVYEDSARRPTMADLEGTLVIVLQDYYQQFPKIKPYRMPEVAELAMRWFMDLAEPAARNEHPHRERNHKNTKYIWRWPYEQRLIAHMIAYLRADEKLQRLIVAAREDNIWWRGDNYDFFLSVIDETERMRDMGRAEYRRKATRAMKGLNLSADVA